MAAIYMWPVEDQILLTTTLYPIDVADGIDFTVSIYPPSCNMELIPNDNFENTWNLQTVSYTQLRWFYSDGPYSDEFENTWSLQEVTYTQLRWFYTDGPYFDEFENTWGLEDVAYTRKMVEADSPDEGLDLSITIIPAGCSMELV